MSQQVTITARGLFLGQNDLGSVPDGALGQADNCVISKDGIVETRRGLASVATKALARLFQFKNFLVGWASTNVLSRSSDNGATWTDYGGTYPAPASPVRAAEMNGNLYFTTSTGPFRLDSFTGTPEPAGIPGGLDVQAVLGAAGTAVPPGNQVAYRVVWGKRDANGNLLLGAPSGRGLVTQPAPYVIAIGNLVRATNVVTATLSAGVTNVFRVGESVTLSPGEANFAAGVKTLTGVTPTTFTYAETAANATNTVAQTFTGPSRDITVTASIPASLPSGAFYQVYRSANSGLETQVPDDNLGLVYEQAAPPGSVNMASLSRSLITVTATTATAHGYVPGMTVTWSAPMANPLFVAVGNSNACATSPDGITWTARTIPAGSYTAVVRGQQIPQWVAVGTSVCATSSDAVTWTARTIPAVGWRAVAWNGSIFCATGVGNCVTSPDGVTWTARTFTAGEGQGVAWNGSVFCSVGNATGANGAATSPDGITWTLRTLPIGSYTGVNALGIVCGDGQFVAVGGGTTGGTTYGLAWTSADGITWSNPVQIPTSGFVALSAVTFNGSMYAACPSSAAEVFTSPNGATWTKRTGNVAGGNALGWSGGAAFVKVGASNCDRSVDGIAWTSQTIPAGTYNGIGVGGVSFGAGDHAIRTVPTPTTFTYVEPGNDGSQSSNQLITPLTVVFTDSLPSGFIGAALYTNPNEGTITAAAARISLCQDIVAFRGFLFAGNVTYPSHANIYLLGVGGTGGIAIGDAITIDGLAYTASDVESASNRTFVAYTTGTPGQNIANTVSSLIRIINRSTTNTITAQYLSGPNDVPGLFYVEERGIATTMTVSFSKPTAWSIQSLKAPENRKSELRWSSANQPDAWPLLNTQQLGSIDKTLIRIVATRDMLVVVKQDGLWRVTGYGGVWDMQPLDPTQGCPAPESMVPFENTVFGVLDSGVVRITEGGVESITAPIYPALEPLLATAALATTNAETFAIAYHSAHKYILWLPSVAGDTSAKQAYVYDSWTQTWARWLPPTGVTGWNHGLVNPADDRMILCDGVGVYREKKAMDDTDLQDATSTPIAVTVKYLPKFGGNPGRLWHFQEVALVFRRVKFGAAAASVSFSTNISPSEETVTLAGTDYGVNTAVGTQTTIRVLIPLEKARGSQLNVKVSHAEAGSAFQLQGLSVVFRPGSTRVGR